MKRLVLPALCVALLVFAACGDSETASGTAAEGGSGGAAAPTCDTPADCIAEACADDEAGTTSCVMGVCETICEAGYSVCTACMDPVDCTFADDLCPPPNTVSLKNCFEGKCSEVCNAPSQDFCTVDTECPKIQCPGVTDAIAQCLGTGCVDVATRCCT